MEKNVKVFHAIRVKQSSKTVFEIKNILADSVNLTTELIT
jgi:hypothetical protein